MSRIYELVPIKGSLRERLKNCDLFNFFSESKADGFFFFSAVELLFYNEIERNVKQFVRIDQFFAAWSFLPFAKDKFDREPLEVSADDPTVYSSMATVSLALCVQVKGYKQQLERSSTFWASNWGKMLGGRTSSMYRRKTVRPWGRPKERP